MIAVLIKIISNFSQHFPELIPTVCPELRSISPSRAIRSTALEVPAAPFIREKCVGPDVVAVPQVGPIAVPHIGDKIRVGPIVGKSMVTCGKGGNQLIMSPRSNREEIILSRGKQRVVLSIGVGHCRKRDISTSTMNTNVKSAAYFNEVNSVAYFNEVKSSAYSNEIKSVKNKMYKSKPREKKYKVVHITHSKAVIRSHIDHELLLFNIFGNVENKIIRRKGMKSYRDIKDARIWDIKDCVFDTDIKSGDKLTMIKSDIKNDKLTMTKSDIKNDKTSLRMSNILIDNYESISPRAHMMRFCPDAKRCLTGKNAGGKSEYSESLSIQYFFERFSARKFILEMDVEYDYFNCKICDFVCDVYGHRVGVSVTRAMKCGPNEFTEESAYVLLKKKMHGLLMARSNVGDRHSFIISFLHIWCQNVAIAQYIDKVYPRVVAEDETGMFKEIIILASVYGRGYIYDNEL